MEVKREKAFAFHLKGTVQCRDPDREMRCGVGGKWGGGGAVGGGEQSSRPLEKGEGRSPKSFFRSFRPQYGLKIRGRAPCPSHGSATAVETHQRPLNSKTRTHKCEIFSVLTSARL